MKNLILIVACLSFGFLNAQTSPEQRAKEQTDKMNSTLSLSTEQYTKVYDVNYGIILKNEGIKNSTYSEEMKQEILKSNQLSRKAMLKNILTTAQYDLMEDKLEIQKVEKKEIKN